MKQKIIVGIILLTAILLFISHDYVILAVNNIFNQNIVSERNIDITKEYIDNLIEENPPTSDSYSWTQESSQNQWKYYNGMMFFALMKIYPELPEKYYDYLLNPDGTVNNSQNPKNEYRTKEVDTIIVSYPLIFLKGDKFELMKKYTYNELKKQPLLSGCGGNFLHKTKPEQWKIYPFALDGLYTALPFWAAYGKHNVTERMTWVNKNLKTKDKLLYHGCTKDGEPNGVVWLRSLGFYSMTIIELLNYVDSPGEKQLLISYLQELFDGLIKVQNPISGMWRNVITKDFVLCNRYETSGTLMIAYAMLEAYSKGYLTDEKYKKAGLKAFNGTVQLRLKNNHLKGIYLSSSVFGTPEEYCVCDKYVQDEAKGIAPLILTYSKVAR